MNEINKNELKRILSYEGVEELIENEKWEELFHKVVVRDANVLFSALQQAEIYPFTLAPEDFPWDYFIELLRMVERGITLGVFTQSFAQLNRAYEFDELTDIAKLCQIYGIQYIYLTDFGFEGKPDYLLSDRTIDRLLRTSAWKDEDYESEDFKKVVFEDI